MKPLLSICIPTYNRCEYLKKSIESIISQKEFLEDKVEIVISDNASTDDTEMICREYAQNHNNFKYFKNTENINDQNFPLAVGRATGIFRKLSGDTLVYYNDSMLRLCKLIETYIDSRPQIFLLNGNFEPVTDEVVQCDNFDSFISSSGFWCTWIGGFGIWDNDCDGISEDIEGCDLKLWQVSKFLSLAARDGKVIIYNAPLSWSQFMERKDVSYGIHKVFYDNFLSILKPYVTTGQLSQETFYSLRKILLYLFFTKFVIVWETSRKNMHFSSQEDLKTLVFKEYENESYWSDYLKYYKKKKAIFLLKKKVKDLLKKTHIWDLLVMLHIKKQ